MIEAILNTQGSCQRHRTGAGMIATAAAALMIGMADPAAAQGSFQYIPPDRAARDYRPDPTPQPVTRPAPVQTFSRSAPQPITGNTVAPMPMQQDAGTVIQGFGSDLPLVVAVRQIVPEGYQFAYGSGVPMASSVSWSGGRGWRLVLRDTLSPLGLDFAERDRVVYIDAAQRIAGMASRPAMGQPQPVAQMGAMTGVTAEIGRPQMIREREPMVILPEPAETAAGAEAMAMRQPVAASADPGASSRAWVVEAGLTLREVLESWADIGGWTIVWNSQRDYYIEASATMSGTFQDAAAELVQAFAQAQPPVLATFYRNRTVVIETQSNGDTE